MKKALLILFIYCGLMSTAWSQQNLNFKTLDVKGGLADNYVRDITRDSYGFMWFSTINGLSRYDGYVYKNYMLDKVGVYNNDVSRVMETADGMLWLVSDNNVLVYNRKKDAIENNGKEMLNKLGIKKATNKLYVDESHNLWASSNEALYNYNYTKKSLTVIPLNQKPDVIDIASRGDVTAILTNDGRFYRVDLNSKKLIYEGETKLSNISRYHHLYLDCRMRLWIYTAHTPVERPLCYSLKENKWVTNPLTEQLQHVNITVIYDDNDGHLWIATENRGVFVCNENEDGPLAPYGISPFLSYNSHINCFYKSGSQMWMGSAKQGVAYTNLNNTLFSLVSTGNREDINYITEDRQGNIWIGFDGDGIARQSAGGNITYYNVENGGTPSNIITSMAITPEGAVWLGTYGEGLARLEGNQFRKIHLDNIKPDNAEALVKCMIADNEGNIWIGTVDNGVIYLGKDGRQTILNNNNSPMMSNSIMSLAIDENGWLYIGNSHGLFIYDTRKQTFITPKKVAETLKNEYFTSIFIDSRGLVWAGSRNGIWIYHRNNGEISHLQAADGLSNNYVRAIVEDKFHYMWLSSDNGITRIQVKEGNDAPQFICQPYYDEDGLQQANFFNNAACSTKDGRCLIGSFKGYLQIQPNQCNITYPDMKVLFTELYIDGKAVTVGDESHALKESMQLTKKVVINDDVNNFAIAVSCMNQAMKQRVSYMYRMKGHGENWNKVNGNYIYFNELPSGSYTLEVKAVAPGGWSSEISTVQIVVKPPFWLSIPALILYGLLALGALWLYILKLKKKQKKTMEVQKMEMELAQQYEMEEKKIKFFTNISHDLKTPLSLVIAPLEKVLSGNIDKSVRTELNMAWKNAKLLLDEITQLLDFRRLDVGSEKLYKSHGDMVSLVQKLVQGFNYFSENRNIHTNLRINVQSLEMDFDENKMRRIINNLLSNAYKYNKEKGTVNVTLGVRHQDGRKMMELQVADTGKGISDEHKEHIFKRFYQESNDGEYIGSGIGLHIVKEYVNMHGGEVTVKDNHPEGSIFVVTIPIDEEQQVKDERLTIQEEGAEQRLMDKSENTEKTGQENSRTTILVVEDNFDSRHFLERSLNDDYEILTASNGKEALDIMKDHDVNLVISDVMMPVMNGLELCNRIKTDVNYSHIPVILLTAKSTEDNIMAGLRDGADEYITKPYNLNILKLRIKKILEWTDEVHQRIANGIEIEPSKITVSSVDEELISKAIRLVEENMQDGNFSVSELSSAIGMTRGHLYKKMMAITGKSPVEFIRILKIKRGRSLLEQGKTNISEVAYAVGYSSKQFSKYFKDEYGCLPSEFLKRNRQTTN